MIRGIEGYEKINGILTIRTTGIFLNKIYIYEKYE